MDALPLSEWQETKLTLHLYMQIVGKVRLSLFPKKIIGGMLHFILTRVVSRPAPFPIKILFLKLILILLRMSLSLKHRVMMLFPSSWLICR